MRPSWPTESWPSRAEEVAQTKAAEIQALEEYAFTLVGADAQRLGLRTDGMVIVHRGGIVYERYARGYDASKRHLGWSVTKSVTSALTGVAVARGALGLDDSVCRHLVAARDEACRITVRHLLEFGSGLDWKETYENESYQVSSVIAMLYGEGRKDIVAHISGHRLRDEPGTVFSYSTGDAALLASVVRAALAPAHGEDYAWKLLFDAVGMKSAVVERDARGNPLGGSHFYAAPRDFARFGYLYLNDGCWDGRRILPENWVRDSTVPSGTYRSSARDTTSDPNGWQWWLNAIVPERSRSEKPWPSAPDDAYSANGHWGQYIVVVPSRDVVIVRVGDDRKGHTELDQLIPLALGVVP